MVNWYRIIIAMIYIILTFIQMILIGVGWCTIIFLLDRNRSLGSLPHSEAAVWKMLALLIAIFFVFLPWIIRILMARAGGLSWDMSLAIPSTKKSKSSKNS